MEPYTNGLLKQIERLTRENAKLRSELVVTRLWNPPAELERAFQNACGWTCLSVPATEDGPAPTLILVAGPAPGADPLDAEAAGRVWRYLLTAAPVRGRIGPFARASMPACLLGYLGKQGGREAIVLNTDLAHRQLARAARLLWSEARVRRPGPYLLLTAPPLLYALGASGARSALATTVPAAIVACVALAPGHVPADTRPAPAVSGPSWGHDHLERAVPRKPPPSAGEPGTPRPSRRAAPTRRPGRPSASIRTPAPRWSAAPPTGSPDTGGAPSPPARPSPPETPSASPSSTGPPPEPASPPAEE